MLNNSSTFLSSDSLDRNVDELFNSKEILKELDKCLMLCANCHRIEHARLRGELDEQGNSTGHRDRCS